VAAEQKGGIATLPSLGKRITLHPWLFVFDIAVFVLKRDIKLQPTNLTKPIDSTLLRRSRGAKTTMDSGYAHDVMLSRNRSNTDTGHWQIIHREWKVTERPGGVGDEVCYRQRTCLCWTINVACYLRGGHVSSYSRPNPNNDPVQRTRYQGYFDRVWNKFQRELPLLLEIPNSLITQCKISRSIQQFRCSTCLWQTDRHRAMADTALA